MNFIQSLHRGPTVSYSFTIPDDDAPVQRRRIVRPSPSCADQRILLADCIERIGRALTAKDLAQILKISAITIFKQAKAGRIPSFRIGTSVRFDPRAVAQWLRMQ